MKKIFSLIMFITLPCLVMLSACTPPLNISTNISFTASVRMILEVSENNGAYTKIFDNTNGSSSFSASNSMLQDVQDYLKYNTNQALPNTDYKFRITVFTTNLSIDFYIDCITLNSQPITFEKTDYDISITTDDSNYITGVKDIITYTTPDFDGVEPMEITLNYEIKNG